MTFFGTFFGQFDHPEFYCNCNDGWGGQQCEFELDGLGPKIPDSDPTKIPTNSTTTTVSENQALQVW